MVYVPVVPYADVTFADALHADRLTNDRWSAITNKAGALIEATLFIDTLPIVGWKTDSTQARQFPRGGDTETPYNVQVATALIALEIGEGNTKQKALNNAGVASEATGGASISYEQGGAMSAASLTRGIMNDEAFALLAPWLRDPELLRQVRV